MITCKDCIFWNRFEEGRTNLGYCQIDPPVIIQTLGNKKGQFPIMEETDWCGQARRKRDQIPDVNHICEHGFILHTCTECNKL